MNKSQWIRSPATADQWSQVSRRMPNKASSVMTAIELQQFIATEDLVQYCTSRGQTPNAIKSCKSLYLMFLGSQYSFSISSIFLKSFQVLPSKTCHLYGKWKWVLVHLSMEVKWKNKTCVTFKVFEEDSHIWGTHVYLAGESIKCTAMASVHLWNHYKQ